MFCGYWDKRCSSAADSKSEKEEGGKARFELSRGHVKKSCHLQLLMHRGADDAGSADGVLDLELAETTWTSLALLQHPVLLQASDRGLSPITLLHYPPHLFAATTTTLLELEL